jgi:uncharacterized membrane protein YeaQ/YmgE (transglycosylase-associated protein family)
MISFDSSSFYLINVLLGLTIGFIAKIVMRPSKPPTAATLSDIWIWLALGVLGAIGGSLMGSLFGWIKPHTTMLSFVPMLTALSGALMTILLYSKVYLNK